MIGWIAVTGQAALQPLALFLIIFLSDAAALLGSALNRSDDYARAGVPMLPVVAGLDRDDATDPGLQQPPRSRVRATVVARICRVEVWRDDRGLRRAFSCSRTGCNKSSTGDRSCRAQALPVLDRLSVRAVCGSHWSTTAAARSRARPVSLGLSAPR